MKFKQDGRSMVEMLGVLAIIGILSAGAMAGYSKAMFQHRINQTIDIFNGVLQRFLELEQKGLGADLVMSGADDIVKYGFLSNCQKTEYDECKLPVGYIWFEVAHSNFFQFRIRFNSSKECVAFSSADWKNAVPVGWWKAGYISIEEDDDYHLLYDPNNYYGYGVYDEITMDNIVQQCAKCDQKDCNFRIVYEE